MNVFIVGKNMVGYLPESDNYYCETWQEAQSAALEDLQRFTEDCEEIGNDELAEDCDAAADDLRSWDGPEWGFIVGDLSFWINCEEMTAAQFEEVSAW